MTARPHKGRRIGTQLRRKSAARPRQASTALQEETKMNLPPQAVPVMRGHDRGQPALAPYNARATAMPAVSGRPAAE
jgi:hypothetical protein